MTLAEIVAMRHAKSATPSLGGVATCDEQVVAVDAVTPATPITSENQSVELLPKNVSDTVHPEALTEALAVERARLLAVAAAECVDAALVHYLQDADLIGCVGLDDGQLAIFLQCLCDTADRHAGRVPKADTALIHCQHCGPVWIHPTIAAVLPLVRDWPRALGCPWCFVRRAGGYIPRPPALRGDGQQVNGDTVAPQCKTSSAVSCHSASHSKASHRHACLPVDEAPVP